MINDYLVLPTIRLSFVIPTEILHPGVVNLCISTIKDLRPRPDPDSQALALDLKPVK